MLLATYYFTACYLPLSLNVQTDSKDSGNLVTATATVKLKDVTR